MLWPVGDFFGNTTRIVGNNENGFENEKEAQSVIDRILRQQIKPHHVKYRVEESVSLEALMETGVLV